MNIRKVKYIAFSISLIAFAIGFSDAGESMFWQMGRPVGAILFGVYMIFMVLEKETSLLDEQQRAAKAEIQQSLQTAPARDKKSNKENCAPSLTTAASH